MIKKQYIVYYFLIFFNIPAIMAGAISSNLIQLQMHLKKLSNKLEEIQEAAKSKKTTETFLELIAKRAQEIQKKREEEGIEIVKKPKKEEYIKELSEKSVKEIEKKLKSDSGFSFLKPLETKESEEIKIKVENKLQELFKELDDKTTIDISYFEKEFSSLDNKIAEKLKELGEIKKEPLGSEESKNKQFLGLLKEYGRQIDIKKIEKLEDLQKFQNLPKELESKVKELLTLVNKIGNYYKLEPEVSASSIENVKQSLKDLIKSKELFLEIIGKFTNLFKDTNYINQISGILAIAETPVGKKQAFNREIIQLYLLSDVLLNLEDFTSLQKSGIEKAKYYLGHSSLIKNNFIKSKMLSLINDYVLRPYLLISEEEYNSLFKSLFEKFKFLKNYEQMIDSIKNIRDQYLKEIGKLEELYRNNPYVESTDKAIANIEKVEKEILAPEEKKKKLESALYRLERAYVQEKGSQTYLRDQLNKARDELIKEIEKLSQKRFDTKILDSWKENVRKLVDSSLKSYDPKARENLYKLHLPEKPIGKILTSLWEKIKEKGEGEETSDNDDEWE